jgi:hypothetical protein
MSWSKCVSCGDLRVIEPTTTSQIGGASSQVNLAGAAGSGRDGATSGCLF